MNKPHNPEESITFTRDAWQEETASEAFGVKKFQKKEKTPGMKAILVTDESFKRAKKRMSEFAKLRVDLPELISAMIDVCDSDDELMRKVGARIIEARRQLLDAAEKEFQR